MGVSPHIITDSRNVTFSVDGISNVAFSWLHLSEDPSFTEGTYTTQPFDDEVEFELSCGSGNGPRTVYARAFNQYGLMSNIAIISFLLDISLPFVTVYPQPITTYCDKLLLAGTKSSNSSIIINGEEVVTTDILIDWSAYVDFEIGSNTLLITSAIDDCIESEPISITIIRIAQPDDTLFTVDILEPSYRVPINDSTPDLTFVITDNDGNPVPELADAIVDGYGEVIILIDGQRHYCYPDKADECAYVDGYGYGYSYGDGYSYNEITSGRGVLEEEDYKLVAIDCCNIILTVSCLRVLIDCICVCDKNVIWTDIVNGTTNYHYVAFDNIHIDEKGFVTGDIVTITNQTGILPRSDAIIIATTYPEFASTWGACTWGKDLFGA